jgi:glycosyltransferase involved in cell wall biosynthesis
MRVVTLSSVFPNPSRPTFGIFVRERIRHLAARCSLRVIAPILWCPGTGRLRGLDLSTIPTLRRDGALPVHHPRVFCPPRYGKALDALFYFLTLLPHVARLRRSFSFEGIDVHFTYPDGVAGALLAEALKCPFMITVRGPHDVRHAGHRLRRLQIAFALRRASRVIAVSSSLAALATQLGVHPSKLRIIPNGVDPSQFYPRDRTAARATLGLPADRPILLSVGALTERKGQHRILDLLPRLVAHRPDLLYVNVGDPVAGERYQRLLNDTISRLKLQDHAALVPARPHTEIPLWMAAADLFCLATRAEGSCNAVLEALATGLPVVTTAVDGNVEVVRDWENGVLVPFWSAEAFQAALIRALDFPWDRHSIARHAHDRSWQRVACQLLGEFQAVFST